MDSSSRDDFSMSTKRALAGRVNQRCSNPDCRASTGGPQVDPRKVLNIGVAAHIAGAAPGGPRYDATMTPEQRADISNGIWLCQTCARLIDNDPLHFGTEILRAWKTMAEQEAHDRIGKPARKPEIGSGVVDKWVNQSYPENAGINRDLTARGYDLRWIRANEENEMVDLQGWEPVLLDQPNGAKACLKIRDHPVVGGYLILVKKKRT